MSHQTFDAFVRRAGVVRHRRAALGLLGGAVLAAWGVPHGVSATPGGHGDPKGHSKCKDKGERQEARKQARGCVGRAGALCLHYAPDVFTAAACAVEAEPCCQLRAACFDQQARQCLHRVVSKYKGHA